MIIDLSVILNEDTPVYPGDPEVKINKAGILARDGFNDHVLTIGTHVGTHIDAPLHMIEGGKTLDQIPVETFIGRGVCVDVRNGKFNLDTVKKADIGKGDIVLFYTGLSDHFNEPEVYFEDYPAIPEDVAEYLVEMRVKMVGVDTCSPEPRRIYSSQTFIGE